MATEGQLAIIIPAYKNEYLATALESLAVQTDRRFRVYVGDDASPGPVRETCERFRDDLDLHYQRFSENLGGTDLVGQWQRCINLSSEPWIWIFSDDDLAEPGCVAAFYAALDQSGGDFDLYRFNTLNIDEHGRVVSICPLHPPVESGLEFAYHRLCMNRSSFISEYIFSRKTYQEHGGMVRFPLAWCSDDASWITFSGAQGIFTIPGPKIQWRKSRINISFVAAARSREKLEACGLFLTWLNRKFTPATVNKNLGIDSRIFFECQKTWLLSQIRHQAPLWPSLWLKISRDQEFSCLGSRLGRFLGMGLIDLVFLLSKAVALLRK